MVQSQSWIFFWSLSELVLSGVAETTKKKSAPCGADLLDTNLDIDSNQMFRCQRYTTVLLFALLQ